MNSRMEELLAAERADAAQLDDEAFARRVVGHLRDATIAGAVVGAVTGAQAVAAAPTLTTTTMTTTTTTTVTATTAVTASTIGVAKAVATAVIAVGLGASTIAVVQRSSTTTPAHPPVAAVAETVAVTPVAREAIVEAPATTAPSAVQVPRRTRAATPVPVPVPSSLSAPSSPTPPTPSAPSELERYDAASATLRAGRVDEAATQFTTLLSTFQNGVLRPEAQMSLLESLYRGGQFAAVVAAVPGALLDVDSVRAADVHRLEGDALVQLGRCAEARTAYTAALLGASRLNDVDVDAALLACTPR